MDPLDLHTDKETREDAREPCTLEVKQSQERITFHQGWGPGLIGRGAGAVIHLASENDRREK